MNSTRSANSALNFHMEVFDLLCTFHRVKRVSSKEAASSPSVITLDRSLSEEQRAEQLNRALYKVINDIEQRILLLPSTSEPPTPEYFDEWSFLTWTLLSTVNRLQVEVDESVALLDYGGKHFQDKIHAALVELVNKAQRMQPPAGVSHADQHFEQFYQAYVTALLSLHELYSSATLPRHNKWFFDAFETQVARFREQLTLCFQLQREFCNNHGFFLWRQMRNSQIQKMTRFGYDNKGFLSTAVSFYSNMLYNLGVLAARLQGFCYETKNSKLLNGKPDLISPLLQMVYQMVDVLVGDSIICIEPSQNPILVTNNLFPMKILSLCRSVFFKDFSAQIVSEEIAQQIQQEMRQRKTFDPPVPIRQSPSAALLAMKPSSGVKRNNATASAEGGNTAHKKSDVNSKEWISISPSFDGDHQGWVATYPHLLCTTRQKDALLDSRSAGQTGKRPLFYFHIRAEMFSFTGGFTTAHTLSLPFAIATRRNQDCQVQRMMSSYTATCFWLYGTNVLDGLMLQWYDNEIEWKMFKILYAQYFSMNAEVTRSLVDEDFNILQMKMHCSECTERSANSFNARSPPSTVTFKNVLCPHLHYTIGKTDVKFSIWRGMLELLHLFSDQRTEVKTLWESGLLLGFLEQESAEKLMQNVESCLIMRLSFVIGSCVCFTVKSGGQLVNLEPLELKRLQAKSLHEYLRDILIAEKIEFILNANKEWMHVSEAMKLCQRSSNPETQECATTREIVSNIMHAGTVDVQQTVSFTALRVAVVTCKYPRSHDDFKFESPETPSPLPHHQNIPSTACPLNDFEERLQILMKAYGKTDDDVLAIVGKNIQNTGQIPEPITSRRQSVPAQIPMLSFQRSVYGTTAINGNTTDVTLPPTTIVSERDFYGTPREYEAEKVTANTFFWRLERP